MKPKLPLCHIFRRWDSQCCLFWLFISPFLDVTFFFFFLLWNINAWNFTMDSWTSWKQGWMCYCSQIVKWKLKALGTLLGSAVFLRDAVVNALLAAYRIRNCFKDTYVIFPKNWVTSPTVHWGISPFKSLWWPPQCLQQDICILVMCKYTCCWS